MELFYNSNKKIKKKIIQKKKIKKKRIKNKITENNNINNIWLNRYILFYSSLFFITNILLALYKKYYFYAILFVNLLITSLIVHTNDNFYTNTIDKCSIVFIVLYGGYILYKKSNKSISLNIFIIITFLACVLLYIYGYFTNNFCFHPDTIVANKYHVLMHIIGSIGHNAIIFL
jgi:hypothetical protein